MNKNKKIVFWALSIGLVVVFSVVASNPSLFKGSFTGRVGGENAICYRLRQTCEGAPAHSQQSHCTDYLNQCGASLQGRCKQLVVWWRNGTLTANVGGNSPGEIQTCETYYPALWAEALATPSECNALALWLQQGVLTQNMQGWQGAHAYLPSVCSWLHPNIWNNPTPPPPTSAVSEARCSQLVQWARQGVLTANAGATGAAEAFQCETQFPDIWAEYYATQQVCNQIAQWRRWAVLSQNWNFVGTNGYVPAACERLYPGLVYTLDYHMCKKIRDWEIRGVLTSNITAGPFDWSSYDECRATYPQIWPAQPSPGPVPQPAPAPPTQAATPTQQRCEQLADWLRMGVLTQNSGGAPSVYQEVTYCQQNYPSTWARAYATKDTCNLLAIWLRNGVLTQNLPNGYLYNIPNVPGLPAACSQVHPALWNNPNMPEYSLCKKIWYWYQQGVLTTNVNNSLGGDWQTVYMCHQSYPTLRF